MSITGKSQISSKNGKVYSGNVDALMGQSRVNDKYLSLTDLCLRACVCFPLGWVKVYQIIDDFRTKSVDQLK